jgi:hypothetical protein
MRTTERFVVQRKKQLEEVFNEPSLVKIWRQIVKKQMRSLDILDLHDYYDFNYRIEERAKHIVKSILSGRYKAHPPLIFKVEKKLGICRHLMLPNPSDALVLQAIVESISAEINSGMPTKKAYYSRDKHNLKLPHEINEPGEYPLHWRLQWKKFQKEILKFSDEYKYLVVTDLTNYFDNIGLRELRHIISSRIRVHEVILDFLFNLIEQLSWNPDYLPVSLKGLPTINLEAPRLLAHALLFELDEILDAKTEGSFVRWMDDINFGVNSVDKACEILGAMNDVLKSRGLALNLGKTTYYTIDEAERHFLVEENKYLDNFEIIEKSDENYKQKTKELKKKFKAHLNNTNLQNWSKVTKRFFTTAAKLKSNILLKDGIKLFKRNPAIRGHITYYFKMLGYSLNNGKAILKILNEANVYDDVTLFHISRLVTDWKIPRSENGQNFVSEVLGKFSKPSKVFELYCYLWIAAKYERPNKILSVIVSNKSMWEQQPFLTRQVVSILPRIRPFKPEKVEQILQEQISIGPSDAASVAHNIINLESMSDLDKKLKPYLFPTKMQNIYPVSKYLVLHSVLESKEIRNNKKTKKYIKEYITDPWMKFWIDEYIY